MKGQNKKNHLLLYMYISIILILIPYSSAVLSLSINVGGVVNAAGVVNGARVTGHITTPVVHQVNGSALSVNHPSINVSVPNGSSSLNGSRALDHAINVRTPEIHDVNIVNGVVYLTGP